MEDGAVTVTQEKQDITVIKLRLLSFLLFHALVQLLKRKP